MNGWLCLLARHPSASARFQRRASSLEINTSIATLQTTTKPQRFSTRIYEATHYPRPILPVINKPRHCTSRLSQCHPNAPPPPPHEHPRKGSSPNCPPSAQPTLPPPPTQSSPPSRPHQATSSVSAVSFRAPPSHPPRATKAGAGCSPSSYHQRTPSHPQQLPL